MGEIREYCRSCSNALISSECLENRSEVPLFLERNGEMLYAEPGKILYF